jgi:hypothetical protein
MLLQQTSKYLMKTIPKKTKGKTLDLSFVHQQPEINLEALEENLRDINNAELLIQDLFRQRYLSAAQKIAELKQQYKEKEEAKLHFHSQAGNALALALGKH